MKTPDPEIEKIKSHRMEVIKPLRCASIQELTREICKRNEMKRIQKEQCLSRLDEIENWICKGYAIRDVYTDEIRGYIKEIRVIIREDL